MSVKRLKPTTPGQRFRVAVSYKKLTKKKPEKSLMYKVKSTGGRNNTGRITVHHRGGGHKRRGRIIDYHRRKFDVPAIIKSIEYDPMRTAFIMLVAYKDGEKSYLLAPEGVCVGDEVVAGEKVAPELGNAMPLSGISIGTFVHNVEFNPGAGGVFARSAGSSAQIVARQEKHVVLKMPSGERRIFEKKCMATVGVLSNGEHSAVVLGKAGRNRWLGRRPHVRGTVKNPVDHPMGGGEGKSSGGHPRSPQGLYAKGKKTRKVKKYSDKLILNPRK